jgi:uncharacterized protein YukE
MANITHGMDLEAVQKFAHKMRDSAEKIDSIVQTLGKELAQVGWKGPDRTRFENEWRGQHTSALKKAAADLHNAAKLADKNVKEQQSASS